MVSIVDIHILDLQGNSYDINSIRRQGNDALLIVIKKADEPYRDDLGLNYDGWK